MSQTAYTMPEAKFRSTKKTAPRARTVRISEFAHEARVAKPKATVKVKQESVKEKDKKSFFSLASWWPVAVGVFLTGFATEWLAMANQIGEWGMRIGFPLVVIAGHSELGFGTEMPHLALLMQLPLEGFLTKLTLDSGKGLKAAIAQLILIHAVATLVLWLITFSGH